VIQHFTPDGRRVYTAAEAAAIRGEAVKTVQTRLLRAGVKPAGQINNQLNVYYPSDLQLEAAVNEHLIILAPGQPDATREWGKAVPRTVVEMLRDSRRAPDERWVVRTGAEAIRRGNGTDLGRAITSKGRWIATAVTTEDGIDGLREWAALHPEVRIVEGGSELWAQQAEDARRWALSALGNAKDDLGYYPSAHAEDRAFQRHAELVQLCDRLGV
jgi:hypothetical protein